MRRGPPAGVLGSLGIALTAMLVLLELSAPVVGGFCFASDPLTCVNGTCVSGECECMAGFGGGACDTPLASVTCPPLVWVVSSATMVPCTNGTRFTSVCVRVCADGYMAVGPDRVTCTFRGEWSSWIGSACEPVCDPPCVNATCGAPNNCSCAEGYAKSQSGACAPVCTLECRNGGSCIAPGECSCPSSFSGVDCSVSRATTLVSQVASATQAFNPHSYKFYVFWVILVLSLGALAVGIRMLWARKRAARVGVANDGNDWRASGSDGERKSANRQEKSHGFDRRREVRGGSHN